MNVENGIFDVLFLPGKMIIRALSGWKVVEMLKNELTASHSQNNSTNSNLMDFLVKLTFRNGIKRLYPNEESMKSFDFSHLNSIIKKPKTPLQNSKL